GDPAPEVGRVEQLERPCEAVALPRRRLDLELPIGELADLLPDRGAGDAERAREVLARVLAAVGEDGEQGLARQSGHLRASSRPTRARSNRDSVPASIRRMLPRCVKIRSAATAQANTKKPGSSGRSTAASNAAATPALIVASPTKPVRTTTATHTPSTGAASPGAKYRSRPAAVAPPWPPRNSNQTGKTWPMIAPNPSA